MVEEKEPTKNNSNNKSGVSFFEGNSSEGLIIYKRRKQIKMTNLDEKMKAADGSAPDQQAQDNHILSFDAFTNGPGECSRRTCSNGHENGLSGCIQNISAANQESGYMPVSKKSVDNAERSDNQTNSSAPTPSHVTSSGLFKQSNARSTSFLTTS